MPFICLANPNLPDGVLQIMDLFPNVSQDNNPTNAPGQNRYLRRPGSDLASVNAVTGLTEGFRQDNNKRNLDGLAAYLVDKVEPGGAEQAGATITLVGVVATDRITIKTIVFEFAVGANSLSGLAGSPGDPFIVGLGADDPAAAVNLTAALNDATDVHAAMDAVATAGVHTDASNPSGAIVDILAEDGGGPHLGPTGDLAVVVTDPTHTVLSPAEALAAGSLVRTNSGWSGASVAAGVAAIQDLVDTGVDATLAAVNAALTAAIGTDLDGAASNSVGTVAELLSILAGRTYRLPAGAVKFTGSTWDPTLRGNFTEPNTVFDTQMLGGEISPLLPWIKHGSDKVPVVTGGDVVDVEIGEARATFDTTAFQVSVNSGQLSRYAAGVTLFPDNDIAPFIATAFQPGPLVEAIVGARVVTVYDDDGTLLV